MKAIIGRKLGMTRIYDDDGRVTPVTVIEAGPCPVVQVRSGAGGAHAVQIGFGERKAKRTPKALAGHVAPSGVGAAPAQLKEFSVAGGDEPPKPGDAVTVDIFAAGELVKVTGTTKGRGFQGVVKRHGFHGGSATHGNTRYRRPGSLGPGTDPSRVIKGKKLPGQYGATTHTELGLEIVRVDAEQNLLYIRGAVPGPKTGFVTIRKQGGKGRYA